MMTEFEKNKLASMKEQAATLTTEGLKDPMNKALIQLMRNESLWVIDLIERLEAQLQEQLKINSN
jgi:hypothetical protein